MSALLPPQCYRLFFRFIEALEVAASLQFIDVSSQKDEHRFQPYNGLITRAPGTVADSSAIWTQTTNFLPALLVIFQAETTIFPPTNVLVI